MKQVPMRTPERREPKEGTLCGVCGKAGTTNFPLMNGAHEHCNRRKAEETDDGR
jgi:hypothetical protein